MIRTRIKSGAARVLTGIGAGRIGGWLSGSRNLPAVIGYHRVVEDFESAAKNSIPAQLVSRKMLERHLDWLARRYRFVTLDEVGAELESGECPALPAAAITFDDGYRDFYDHAFPLLQKRGIPAAVFVVTDLVGASCPQLHDKLYLLLLRRRGRLSLHDSGFPDISRMSPYHAARALIENLPLGAIQKVVAALEAEDPLGADDLRPFQLLDWETLRKIHRAGITIGSHTRSHALLPGEQPDVMRDQTVESRRTIENRLGIPVRHFAYPSGNFNPRAVSAVAHAGYRYGYTGCVHRSKEHPLLTIPRTVLWEKSSVDAEQLFSPSILDCQIHHAFDLVSGCRQSDHLARGRASGRV